MGPGRVGQREVQTAQSAGVEDGVMEEGTGEIDARAQPSPMSCVSRAAPGFAAVTRWEEGCEEKRSGEAGSPTALERVLPAGLPSSLSPGAPEPLTRAPAAEPQLAVHG